MMEGETAQVGVGVVWGRGVRSGRGEEDVDRLAEVVPEVEWDEMEGFLSDVDEDGDMDFLGDEDDMALLWDAFCDRFDESEDDELDDYMLPFGF